MLDMVSPFAVTAVDIVTGVSVVDVGVVNVDIAVVTPATIITPAASPGRSQEKAGSKCQPHSRDISRVRNRRVGISRLAINHNRIIGRNVNHIRLCLFDDDHLLAFDGLCFNNLFRIGLECPGPLGLRAHPLDSSHHVARLRKIGVAQLRRPLDVLGKTHHHIREPCHRLDARIPVLFQDRVLQGLVLQILVSIQPLLELNNLKWISRGRHGLCQ